MHQNRLAVGLSASGVLWCFAVAIWLSQVPMMRGGRRPSAGEALLMVALPAAAAALATWAAWQRHPIVYAAAAVVLALFSFVTGFSIGRAFLPALALLVWGGLAMAGSGPAVEQRGRR